MHIFLLRRKAEASPPKFGLFKGQILHRKEEEIEEQNIISFYYIKINNEVVNFTQITKQVY